MPYKKKNLTPEQRSELARKAVAARKTHGGGRPKGSQNKNPINREPVRSIQVKESAYKVFNKLAGIAGVTLVGFMSKVAESLKTKNAKHFTDEPPVQM